MRVEQTLPSQVLPQITDVHCTLAELIYAGYDLRPNGTGENPLDAVKVEFNYDDKRTDIFLAREGERVIGSLTLIKWQDKETDKRGHLFYPKLRELAPFLASRLVEINPMVCDVAGVVTHPDYRGTGIAKVLLKEAIRTLNPTIIGGQTKTVGAVMVRSRLDALGYRTFYGSTEVTSSNPYPISQIHTSLYQAYSYAREVTEYEPEGLVHQYHGGIAPTIPDTTGYPLIIQTAFEPVIQAQRRIGLDGPTVMSFLLSAKAEIFK